MKKYPAIAVVEFSSIADGIFTTDAILKKAPIAMIKGGTVSGGRYLIIFGGTTGSVSESLTEALTIGSGSVLDHAFLPDVHPKVHDADARSAHRAPNSRRWRFWKPIPSPPTFAPRKSR